MLHEVKVLDAKGKLKKTLKSKELSKRYWNDFYGEDDNGNTIVRRGKKFKRKNEYDDNFLEFL